MKTILKLSLALLLTLGISTGCKKYVDGPKISLLTKKSRLAGVWKVENATYKGDDITSSFNGLVLTINKNGTYKSVTPSATEEGKWELGEDKDDVYFTANTPGSLEQAYRILRLKSKQLWLRNTASNGDQTIIHYIPN